MHRKFARVCVCVCVCVCVYACVRERLCCTAYQLLREIPC
jgi:hypothetical protein